MKTHKRTKNNLVDKDFPLLPWKRQEAIVKFVLYGTIGDEVFFKAMSRAERRFYRAVLDVIDAYGPVPDARHREVIRITPISDRR
jgi:hypothetical protein